jgi:hypothetical protein
MIQRSLSPSSRSRLIRVVSRVFCILLINRLSICLCFQQEALAQSGAVESTGGNAALMANKLASVGCNVLLGGPVGDRLARLLNPAITLAEPDAKALTDEVHLILEYQQGESWVTTPSFCRLLCALIQRQMIFSHVGPVFVSG